MKEFQSEISLDDVFSDTCTERVEEKNRLSNLCKEDVRKGKVFLCYC